MEGETAVTKAKPAAAVVSLKRKQVVSAVPTHIFRLMWLYTNRLLDRW